MVFTCLLYTKFLLSDIFKLDVSFSDSIFAPKDIDLENGEIDDDEKEIEAFKRFCFDSVPLQQKTKVNFDVKNIAFKKK